MYRTGDTSDHGLCYFSKASIWATGVHGNIAVELLLSTSDLLHCVLRASFTRRMQL